MNDQPETAPIEVPADHFLPVASHELVAQMLEQTTPDSAQCQRFFTQLELIFQMRAHARGDALQRRYLAFDPDTDTPLRQPPTDGEPGEIATALGDLLERANFRALPISAIEQAMTANSPAGVAVSVSMGDFELLQIHARGQREQFSKVRDWHRPWTQRSVRMLVIRRLVMVFVLAPSKTAGKRRWLPWLKPAPPPEQRLLHLKYFKDIPQADLEMLFPNCDVRMKPLDKIKLSITGGGGTVGGFAATVGKVSAAANPLALLLAVGGFLGLLIRQLRSVLAQRTTYMMRLSRKLYFHSLANGQGVISRIVDLARDEDFKEAALAWHLLNRHGPATSEDLDQLAERWLQDNFGCRADFEIDDALSKLSADQLVVRDGPKFQALDPAASIERLDIIWSGWLETGAQGTAPTSANPI